MSSNAPNPNRKPLQRTKIGTVTSDKRDKTRTVVVQYQRKHPKYGKYLQRQTRYLPLSRYHQYDHY